MSKTNSNIFIRFFKNIYLRNIFLMVVVFVVLLLLTLLGLNFYTRHGHSVDVPDLTGLQVEEAAAVLTSVGLEYEVIDSLYEKKGIPGAVLDQVQKPDSKVKSGRVIYLVVQANGKEMVVMPDVEDNSYRQAESLLSALGFKNIQKETIPSQYKDLVFSVTYKGRVVKPGEKIPLDAVLTLKAGAGSGVEEDEEHIPEFDYSDVIEETVE